MQPLINMVFQLQPTPAGQATWAMPAPAAPTVPLAILPPHQVLPEARTVPTSPPAIIQEIATAAPPSGSFKPPVRIDSRSPTRAHKPQVPQEKERGRRIRSESSSRTRIGNRSRSRRRVNRSPPTTVFRQQVILKSVTPSRMSRLDDNLANAPWRTMQATKSIKKIQRPISPSRSPRRGQGVWKSPTPAPNRQSVSLSWPNNLSLPERRQLPAYLRRSEDVNSTFPPVPPPVPPPVLLPAIVSSADHTAQPSTPPDAFSVFPAEHYNSNNKDCPNDSTLTQGGSSSAYIALPDNIHTVEGRRAFVHEENLKFQRLTDSCPEVRTVRAHIEQITKDEVMRAITTDNLNLLCKILACTTMQGNVHYPMSIKMDTFDNYQVFQLPILAMRGASCPESSVGLQRYMWCHGTTTQGIIGILKARQVLKSLPSPEAPTYGFFAAGTNDATSKYEQLRITVARWESSKNDAGLLVLGTAASTRTQAKVHAGGTYEEQRKCKTNDVAHNPKERRWCIKPKISQITALCFCQIIETVTSPE
jgi:hypothetical protein